MIVRNPDSHEGSCYAFANRDIILRSDGSLPSFDDLKILQAECEGGDVAAEPEYGICFLNVKKKDCIPDGFITKPLRIYNYEQTQEEVLRSSRAKALAEWLVATRFCCKCGKPLVEHESLTALECKECNNLVFPRIEPCIIVLVRRGKQMLLARHAQRNQDIYACIAGFMEAGESAEECVKREIKEETGINVKNVKYFGSQSWPFPSQLMLGFTAEYESGELKLQEDEIADAAWFDEDKCPATPQPGSIAHRLIHNISEI